MTTHSLNMTDSKLTTSLRRQLLRL